MQSPRTIFFLDLVCPKPYDTGTLRTTPQGGTESTVTRIADGLSRLGHTVNVYQHCRQLGVQQLDSASYLPIDSLDGVRPPDVAVCLRTPAGAPFMAKRWPDSKRFIWLHDFNMNEVVTNWRVLKDTSTVLLCVSRTHKTLIADALLSRAEGLRVKHVYNPIDESLAPDSTLVDKDKLVFFSSPHKGLDLTLKQFQHVRRALPEMKLYVANPGYLTTPTPLVDPGVKPLGCLTHSEVIQHVRSALAVFHMNTEFAETFGLVAAEAQAVGTPILTHRLGALPEVLSDDSAFVDARNTEAVVDRIVSWHRERPAVGVRDDFRLSNVLDSWSREVLK